jgi:hypothetical protein
VVAKSQNLNKSLSLNDKSIKKEDDNIIRSPLKKEEKKKGETKKEETKQQEPKQQQTLKSSPSCPNNEEIPQIEEY